MPVVVADLIKRHLRNAVKDVFDVEIDVQDIALEYPNDEKWGDYATNLPLRLAPLLKQAPLEIAKKLTYELNDVSSSFTVDTTNYAMFEKIYLAPPGFINFVLSKDWLYCVLYKTQDSSTTYGSVNLGRNKRIALEHSNVNPNKAAHVGHLRNACIGQFVERVHEFLGYDVEVQYLDNDLGVQVTTSLMGVDTIKSISPDDYEKFDHYAWDIYSKMESLISEDPALSEKRQEIMTHLEDTTHPISKRQSALADKILVEQLRTFQKLDFDYDVVVRERDVISTKMWEQTFAKLKKTKNVYFAKEGPSKGCWLVRFATPSTDNPTNAKVSHDTAGDTMSNQPKRDLSIEEDKIIVRSNGVPTYTGKDVAYHMWKFGLLDIDFDYTKLAVDTQSKPLWATTSNLPTVPSSNIPAVSFSGVDMVFNVVDVTQTYALEVVKQALAYLGYTAQADNLVHINYGFVYLSPNTAKDLGIDISDGKVRYGMSGRKGWGVKIDDFIEMVDNVLLGEFGDFDALQDVRNSAIKFEMLKHNTFHDLVFDLNAALDIHGYSGPYIQYTYARGNSVVNKSGYQFNAATFESIQSEIITSLQEKELEILKSLNKFPEVVVSAASDFAPNHLCTYLFELSQKYNSFYNALPILNAPNNNTRESRVLITMAVQSVLKTGLFLLGIKTPSKM